MNDQKKSSRGGAPAQTSLSPSQYGSNKRSLGARQVLPHLWCYMFHFFALLLFKQIYYKLSVPDSVVFCLMLNVSTVHRFYFHHVV